MKSPGPNLEDLKSRSASGRYEHHGAPAAADCVIGFAFGFRRRGTVLPGLSNEDLAHFIADNFPSLPKIIQFEIADAAPALEQVFRIEKHRQEAKYLDTREVALQAFELMKRHGWEQAVIVAHPGHMPRADAVCQKIGIATIAPVGLEVVRFDPHSEQAWTRDSRSWAAHEDIAIPDSYKRGWL
jgi:hypothetical protein